MTKHSEGGADSQRVRRRARALGDPTRFAIFEAVAAADAAVGVAALVQQFALNHNAVRQHLAKLCEAGLLVDELAARRGPGRPALQYRLAPGVQATWNGRSPYEQLSLYLLEVAQSGRAPRDVGADAGRAAAAAVDGHDGPTLDRLVAELKRRGFEPRQVPAPAHVEISLDFCPFATAAAAAPQIVCEIHRGLVEGFVDGAGGGVTVTDLDAKDPDQAGCRLTLQVQGPTSACR